MASRLIGCIWCLAGGSLTGRKMQPTDTLLVTPFGASCALVFGAPASRLAQPRNVIGGHLISTAVGLRAAVLIGVPSLAMAVGVGLAIAGMLLTDTLHSPAGADPIVVVLAHATPALAGVLSIVLMGIIYHRALTGALSQGVSAAYDEPRSCPRTRAARLSSLARVHLRLVFFEAQEACVFGGRLIFR